MIDLNEVLSRNPDAAFRVYEGQATVVLPGRSEVKVLNEVGSRIWEAIDGRRSLGQILEDVLREFDIGPDQARADLTEFVAALREHGMVN
jgi:hypothetical protein